MTDEQLKELDEQIDAMQYALGHIGTIPMMPGSAEYKYRITLHEMHLKLLKRKNALTQPE